MGNTVQLTKDDLCPRFFMVYKYYEKAIPGLYPRPAGEARGCAQHLPCGKTYILKGQWREMILKPSH
jgi:hypothetical protein